MANNCYYQMKINGTKENVKDFIDAMKWQGKYKDSGVGRIFSCECYDEYQSDINNSYSAFIDGDCAWSIQSAMIKDILGNSLQNDIVLASKTLQLRIEAYSQECGCAFQEHYIFDKGETVVNECIGWTEYDVENLETDNEAMESFLNDEEIRALGITRDNYKDFINDNNCIEIGGFEEWKWSVDN